MAIRTDADESYWSYKAASPTPGAAPPGMKSEGWTSLSPGMRREIWRDFERRNPGGNMDRPSRGDDARNQRFTVLKNDRRVSSFDTKGEADAEAARLKKANPSDHLRVGSSAYVVGDAQEKMDACLARFDALCDRMDARERCDAEERIAKRADWDGDSSPEGGSWDSGYDHAYNAVSEGKSLPPPKSSGKRYMEGYREGAAQGRSAFPKLQKMRAETAANKRKWQEEESRGAAKALQSGR